MNYAIVTAERRGRLWTRRVASVFAGLVTIFILSSAIDFVLESTGVLPGGPLFDTGLLLLAIAYRTLVSILGCYITARLAPDHRLRHALALGALGVILSTLAAIANTQFHLGPDWYPIALILVALPCAWTAGRLAERGLIGGVRVGRVAESQ
jgi:hypothetical protein